MGSIGLRVKEYLLAEFLPGEDAGELTESTPLIASGILDSLATLKLSAFVEEEFDVQIEPHELDEEHIGTLSRIEELISSKKS